MKFLKNNFDIVLIYILTFLIFLPRSINFCEEFKSVNFDTQNLFLWSFSHELGAVPIKDTYFPYGIIFYGVNYIKYLFLLYINIAPIIFSSIYIIFIKIFGRSGFISKYLFIIYFFISTSLEPRIQPIDRYFSLFAISFILFTVNEKYKNKIFKYSIFGAINGIFMFYDPGMGMIALLLSFASIAFFNFYDIVKIRNKRTSFAIESRNLLYYSGGFLFGLIPYIIYLYKNDISFEFFRFIKDIESASSFVKSPVLVLRKYHMLIFSVIFIESLYFIYAIENKFKRYSKQFYYYLFSNYIISLLLLQKHFLRQMQNIMMIYSFNGIILLLYPVYSLFKNDMKKKIYFCTGIFVISLLFVISFAVQVEPYKYLTDAKSAIISVFDINYTEKRMCHLEDIDKNNITANNSYFKVSDYIRSEYKVSRVFSYPYDLIFYPILKQKPPPYPNVYEGSPIYAQDENINYIKNRNIDTIIYNLNDEAVDFIPEYIRTPKLNKYILLYFTPVKIIDNFVIMRKNTNVKYFIYENTMSDKYENLTKKILKNDFGAIFYSEGYYNADRVLKYGQIIFDSGNIDLVNEFLKKEKGVQFDNLLILIKFNKYSGDKASLLITSDNLLTTEVDFKPCFSNYCLIDPVKLPIFYENHKILNIKTDHKLNSVLLVKYDNSNSLLW